MNREEFISYSQTFQQQLHRLLELGTQYEEVYGSNPYFTPRMVTTAFEGICGTVDYCDRYSETPIQYLLSEDSVCDLINRVEESYNLSLDKIWELNRNKRVLIIAAGNIPAAAFADFFAIMACGFSVSVKLSHSDIYLMKNMVEKAVQVFNLDHSRFDTILMESCNQSYQTLMAQGYNAIIFSGSNISKSHVERIAKSCNIPLLARGSTFSLGILEPQVVVSEEVMLNMAFDLFSYYGRGCRNISYLFLPENFPFEQFVSVANREWGEELLKNPWIGNYLQNRAIAQVQDDDFIDGERFLLKKSQEPFPQTTVIHYDTYTVEKVAEFIARYSERGEIQEIYRNRFGVSQNFYFTNANNTITETIQFLSNLLNEKSLQI